MVVQHNLQAMNSNRMLNTTTKAQSKSTEKLSSGYKINRAADDAAGLAISEKMRKQIRGLDQASTNAEDGISCVQTAEGALSEVQDMIQRMNELAVQAANGTNSESDRQSIQDEIEQLTSEIDRVAETTKFNETFLLKGDTHVSEYNVNAHDAGITGTLTNGDNELSDTATFTMKALKVGDSITIAGKAYTIGAVGADAEGLVDKADADVKEAAKSADASGKITIAGTEYTIKYTKDGTSASEIDDAAGTKLYWDATNKVATTTNNGTALTVTHLETLAKADGTTTEYDGSKVTVMTDAGADGVDDNSPSLISKAHAYDLIETELGVASSIGTETAATATKGTEANGEMTFTITKGKISYNDALSFNLHVGSDATMSNKIQININVMNSSFLGLKGLNVKGEGDDGGIAATYAIDAIADALIKVSEQRALLGAAQNRLEHTVNNLDNVVENTTSAESRIRDTDMAEEMVSYSKNNILAQAGQSMLAQANQATQGVLSLLQG